MSDKTSDVIVVGASIIKGVPRHTTLPRRASRSPSSERTRSSAAAAPPRARRRRRQSGRDPRELPLAMYAVKNLWPTLSRSWTPTSSTARAATSALARPSATSDPAWPARQGRGPWPRHAHDRRRRGSRHQPYLSEEVIGASLVPGQPPTAQGDLRLLHCSTPHKRMLLLRMPRARAPARSRASFARS